MEAGIPGFRESYRLWLHNELRVFIVSAVSGGESVYSEVGGWGWILTDSAPPAAPGPARQLLPLSRRCPGRGPGSGEAGKGSYHAQSQISTPSVWEPEKAGTALCLSQKPHFHQGRSSTQCFRTRIHIHRKAPVLLDTHHKVLIQLNSYEETRLQKLLPSGAPVSRIIPLWHHNDHILGYCSYFEMPAFYTDNKNRTRFELSPPLPEPQMTHSYISMSDKSSLFNRVPQSDSRWS